MVKFKKFLLCSFSILIASGWQPAFGTTNYETITIGTGASAKTAIYEVHGYRFDVGTPVNVRIQTTRTDWADAYGHAYSVLTTAIPGFSLQYEDLPIWDTAPGELFPRDYFHTVAFAEIDTGDNLYDAVAIGYDIQWDPSDPNDNGTFISCISDVYSVDFDSSTGDITGISIGSGSIIADTCDNQTISTGLIIMNTNEWPSLFGGTPPQDMQEHWVIHEFTHLLGVGHLSIYSPTGECISMMTQTISDSPCDTMPAPTDYIDTDLELLRQLGYR